MQAYIIQEDLMRDKDITLQSESRINELEKEIEQFKYLIADNIGSRKYIQAIKIPLTAIELIEDGLIDYRFGDLYYAYKGIPKRLQRLMPVENPFEVCFAYIMLLNNCNDQSVLQGPAYGVLSTVVRYLPWDPDARLFHRLEDPWEVIKKESRAKALKFRENPIYTNLFKRQFFNRNAAQLIYTFTHAAIPHNIGNYGALNKYFVRYGADKEMAMTLIERIMIAGAANHRIQAKNFISKISEIDTAEEIQKIELDNIRLRKEIKALRDELHNSKREKESAESRIEELHIALEAERSESADLRDLVFRLNQNEPEDEPQENLENQLPYTVRYRVVIVGGHDRWLKQLRPLLKGNVRFIDKDVKAFDKIIVRNSDTIWLQVNAMSHTQFYRVVDTARFYGKQIRYFTYVSAVKDAIQVMEADMGKT